MAYSWFSPHGSNRDGIRRTSAPAVIRCASCTENPTHPRTLSLCSDSNRRSISSRSGRPVPSITTCTSCPAIHGIASPMMSTPFWWSSRPMNPISGTSSRTCRPSCRCSASLHCFLPVSSVSNV
ncbi:Os02g0744800 [Oryza sativa Japonica Group]|uniref:Os02g0744800 protein n=1 Tax=Oryza sativa subsp. japonica TaxID=39947 RepID=A0A0P0VPN3_ORYSJ|nr:hypothetical protein EE612_013653 [Oryza sativa]BAS80893.1 Os02g0744800 [Oryza sativa Japonica Group]